MDLETILEGSLKYSGEIDALKPRPALTFRFSIPFAGDLWSAHGLLINSEILLKGENILV